MKDLLTEMLLQEAAYHQGLRDHLGAEMARSVRHREIEIMQARALVHGEIAGSFERMADRLSRAVILDGTN